MNINNGNSVMCSTFDCSLVYSVQVRKLCCVFIDIDKTRLHAIYLAANVLSSDSPEVYLFNIIRCWSICVWCVLTCLDNVNQTLGFD